MKQSKFTDEQILAIVKASQASLTNETNETRRCCSSLIY